MAGEKKVLLVDDDAVRLGDSLQEMLNSLAPDSGPYRVNWCTNYNEAVSMLDGVDIVLVGVDLTIEYIPERYRGFLPQIDEGNAGYRLIRYIKEEYPRVKTIALATFSGCKEPPETEEATAKEKGAKGFIVKPLRAMELVSKIVSL